MEYGDFEIDGFVVFLICMTIFLSILTFCSSKENIEREKTKQLQIQQNMLIEERGNNNGTNN